MADALLTGWTIGVAVAAVVVLVVVLLLGVIILQARGILAAAVACLEALRRIRSNVEPVWLLEATNQSAEKIRRGAANIEVKTRLLAEAVEVHGPAEAAQRRSRRRTGRARVEPSLEPSDA